MFTLDQLKAMISAQCEDWTPEYFKGLVEELGDPVLANYINTLDFDQISKLQLALDLLGELPEFKESVEKVRIQNNAKNTR